MSVKFIPGRRVLYVDVTKAKNIAAFNKKNGTSDAYCVVTLEGIGGREIKKEKFQTQIKSKTLAPEWKERFCMGTTFSLFILFLSCIVIP